MDDQQQSNPGSQEPAKPASEAATPDKTPLATIKPQPAQTNTDEPFKTLKLTDEQARSLLTINKLDSGSGAKSSKSFLVLVAASVVVLIAITLFIEARNHVTSSKTGGSSTSSITNPSKNPFTSNGSVDSQVKYCSNPINAQTSC